MLTQVLMNTCMPYYHPGQSFFFYYTFFLFCFLVSSPFPFYFISLPAFVFLPPAITCLSLHLHPIVFLPFLAYLSLVFLHPCISFHFVLSSWNQPANFQVNFSCFQLKLLVQLLLFGFFLFGSPFLLEYALRLFCQYNICTYYPSYIGYSMRLFLHVCMHNISLSTTNYTLCCCWHCGFVTV